MEDKKLPIKEWLRRIPFGIGKMALNNTSEENKEILVPDMAIALSGAFAWELTKEGKAFWNYVFVCETTSEEYDFTELKNRYGN